VQDLLEKFDFEVMARGFSDFRLKVGERSAAVQSFQDSHHAQGKANTLITHPIPIGHEKDS